MLDCIPEWRFFIAFFQQGALCLCMKRLDHGVVHEMTCLSLFQVKHWLSHLELLNKWVSYQLMDVCPLLRITLET